MKDEVTFIKDYGFKSERDSTFPPMVFAEITNVCNLRCIHCPYSLISQENFYRPRHMKINVFKKIVEQVAEFENIIFRIVCDGEPMANPNFLEMIDYAKRKKIYPLCINTNGTLLDKEACRKILQCGVDVVEISLDAINKNTYERIRRGADYDAVMLNTLRFIEMRNKTKSHTKILVSIIDQREVRAEVKEFVTYWESRVDRVIIRAYTSIGGLMDRHKMQLQPTSDRWPCPLLWTRVFINVDGYVKFCVEDWLDKTIVGDIESQDLETIWKSDKYQILRNSHLSKKFDQIEYCKNCIDWPVRKWQYDYFYALDKILEN